jgi:hypothetical protein
VKKFIYSRIADRKPARRSGPGPLVSGLSGGCAPRVIRSIAAQADGLELIAEFGARNSVTVHKWLAAGILAYGAQGARKSLKVNCHRNGCVPMRSAVVEPCPALPCYGHRLGHRGGLEDAMDESIRGRSRPQPPPRPARPPASFATYDAGFTAYESGKHRRYELLFAVNGGAFAIAKLFPDQAAQKFLGGLTIDHLALGMIAFTAVMFIDIAAFGHGMRRWARRTFVQDWRAWQGIFSLFGWFVLAAICALICGGWYLVQCVERTPPVA